MLISGCNNSRPDKNRAAVDFEKKYPAAKVIEVVVDVGAEKSDSRTFTITYQLGDSLSLKSIRMSYWKHGVTDRWVQVPPLPEALESVVNE